MNIDLIVEVLTSFLEINLLEVLTIPVCKKCHNYVMFLDEDNPCPHCGSHEPLTERTDDDFKPIIPQSLQFDFKKEIGDESNVYLPPSLQEIYGNNNTDTESSDLSLPDPLETATKRISQDIPLEDVIQTVDTKALDPASQKVYLQLSIEFQIILNNASNYRQGLFRWNLILPDRLQTYGLTEEAWEIIAKKGDADEKIQEHLNQILKAIFG